MGLRKTFFFSFRDGDPSWYWVAAKSEGKCSTTGDSYGEFIETERTLLCAGERIETSRTLSGENILVVAEWTLLRDASSASEAMTLPLFLHGRVYSAGGWPSLLRIDDRSVPGGGVPRKYWRRPAGSLMKY
jgi:hypothetical protein